MSLWQNEFLRTAVLPSCVWSTEWDVTNGKLNLSFAIAGAYCSPSWNKIILYKFSKTSFEKKHSSYLK